MLKRVYAELFCLFYRFYRARSDRYPLVSAALLLAAVETICFVVILLLLAWLGLVSVVPRDQMVAVVAVGIGLSFLNLLYLRADRAELLLAEVGDSSCNAGRWALVAVFSAALLTILLFKGLLVG